MKLGWRPWYLEGVFIWVERRRDGSLYVDDVGKGLRFDGLNFEGCFFMHGCIFDEMCEKGSSYLNVNRSDLSNRVF